MAATDAKFVPIRNVAYRVYFPLLDADGDLVTAAAGLDSEVSKDGGTFADCTNEATEIATSSGMYYLDLTSTEMDADAVCVIVKTSTSGAKTTPIVLYTASRDIDDLAYPTTSGRSIDVTTGGEVGIDLDNAAGTLDAAQFGTDAFTAAKFAADVTTELQAGLATAAALTTAQADLDDIQTRLPVALVGGRMDSNVQAMANDVVTAAAIATDAIGSAELAATAVTEIQSGLATSAALTIAQADLDDIQTRLPAALVSGRMDSSVGAMAANTMTAAAAAADLTTELQTGLATAASQTTIISGVAAVQADTDDIQARLPASLVAGRMDSSVGAMAANTMTAAAAAADLTTEIAAGIAVPTAAAIADAVWDEATTGHTTSGTFGEQLKTDVDAILDDTGTTGVAVADKAGYALSAAGVDAILDDPIAEPASIYTWPATLRSIVGILGAVLRNKKTSSANAVVVRNDADNATIFTRGVSDDGTTFTAAEGS